MSKHILREAGQACMGLPGVGAAEVYDDDPLDRPVLELTISAGHGGVPAHVLRSLGEEGITVREVKPRPDHYTLLGV